jgi:2,4-dienoyl-CoA reductase-like NADH-dependent reductase (Old Yellow Enzyme family)
LETPDNAEAILSGGEADLVAIARGAIGDPSWPQKLADGVDPVAFDPEMISPFATLNATAQWRAANGVTFEP